MAVLYIESWVVKPECQGEHDELWGEFMNYFQENPDLFREIISMRFYKQTFGSQTGAFVQVIEFDSLSQKENLDRRLSKDEESLRFHNDLIRLKDPATVSACMWEEVDIEVRV